MANFCESCGKGPQVGALRSHSNIKTLRRFNPNIQKKKLFDADTGAMRHVKVCTNCIKTLTRKDQKIPSA